MPSLVLGPMLRRVDESTAAVWVETDAPCRVNVLDAEVPTFTVHGHHYALVEILGLEPGEQYPYTVSLDGQQVWPEPASPFPQSVIKTLASEGPRQVAFGSCRITAPQDAGKHGVDMLYAYGRALADGESPMPDVLLMLGDQVYADEPPQQVRDFIASRRDGSDAPIDEVVDFEEYAELYRQAWTEPEVRWLLSTVPVLSIFDDHDLRDDWNTSMTWRETIAQQPWWQSRVKAGLGSYWVYQHLGNLSAKDRAADPLYAEVRASEGDAGQLLDRFALRANDDPSYVRWSYQQDFGGTRLIMLDSRCARDLTPGRRRMVNETEWEWFREQASAEVDQLLVASSVPVLLPTGLHYVESWNEAVCDGVWGGFFAKIAEKIRQTIDLEHWGAFRESFRRMAYLVMGLVRGENGTPPARVMFLSGDVHYSYLATAKIKRARGGVHQVTCSPLRHPLNRLLRWANVIGSVRVAGVFGRMFARMARVHRNPFRWKISEGPWFDNALATLDIDGRGATVAWHTATPQRPDELTELDSAWLS